MNHNHTHKMESEKNSIKILMLPLLAHGHVSPFLELSKRLAQRSFQIYICTTKANFSSIKAKITEKYAESIRYVELKLPSSPELPPELHTGNGLPPHLLEHLDRARDNGSPSFSNVLAEISPDLVIYDIFMMWAPEVASSYNTPAVQFLSFGASMASFCIHKLERPDEEFPFPEIYLRDNEKEVCEARTLFWAKIVKRLVDGSRDIVLIKACDEIEGKYIDYLSKLLSKKVVPVGPLVQECELLEEEEEEDYGEVMHWLDKKDKKSVVFVSFGSEGFLSNEERNELAKGLELSNVSFIWAIRFPIGEHVIIQDAFPAGFLEGVKAENRGFIVKGWAPQAAILSHPSTGGFVSHCGWSSLMESMKFGVPIVALTIHTIDQPINAKLVEAVGVGVEAVKDENRMLQHGEIANAVRKVVLDESGEDIRRRAREISERLRMTGDKDLDAMSQELSKVCN